MPKDWVDRHSVTCALCGGLADERETISLWEDDRHDPTMRKRVAAMPDGEAHTECFATVVVSDDDDPDFPDDETDGIKEVPTRHEWEEYEVEMYVSETTTADDVLTALEEAGFNVRRVQSGEPRSDDFDIAWGGDTK